MPLLPENRLKTFGITQWLLIKPPNGGKVSFALYATKTTSSEIRSPVNALVNWKDYQGCRMMKNPRYCENTQRFCFTSGRNWLIFYLDRNKLHHVNNLPEKQTPSVSLNVCWAPIETAPKDGKQLILWCASAERMIMAAAWSTTKNIWVEWDRDGFGNMDLVRLEPYEIPTHWMRVEPPTANATVLEDENL